MGRANDSGNSVASLIERTYDPVYEVAMGLAAIAALSASEAQFSASRISMTRCACTEFYMRHRNARMLY